MESGDIFDDDSSFRTPPPPDDRLWRHPSEVGWSAGPPKKGRGMVPLVVVSGLAGAVVAIGMLAATGSIGRRIESREVVEREAVRPAVATVDAGDAMADRVAEAIAPSIVQLHITADGPRVGCAVVFRDDGHVITNAHIVAGASAIQAIMANGHTVTAHLVGADTDTDLAVLKLDGNGPFVPAVLGTTDGTAVGDVAITVGVKTSSGVVSAIGREITPQAGQTLIDMIQTDATVDNASSGGALLGPDGSVIGITTAYAGTSRVGFATPVDVARAVADDLMHLGHVRPVWLGIKGSTAPDGGGVVIADVVTPGPAAQAGVLTGDVIRRVAGHPVATMSELRVLLRRNHPGDPVTVVYDRNGARHSANVVLAEHPAT